MARTQATAYPTAQRKTARTATSSKEGIGRLPTRWSTRERSMMPTSSRRKASVCTKRNAPTSDPSVTLRLRKEQLRVRLTDTRVSTIQGFNLSHRGRTLSLRTWARRTQAGTPTEIWSRLVIGFPTDEALGGSAAVAKALAYLTFKQRRDADVRARRAHALKRRSVKPRHTRSESKRRGL